MSEHNDAQDPALSELELRRVVPLAEASRLTSLSEDSIRRHHRDKLVRMSPGRLGMTVKAVLSIARPVV
jgi:hypothetical protein